MEVAPSLWKSFDQQLNALSKFFSKRDCADLYVEKHIMKNDGIPPAAKKSLAAMFDSLCPTFIKTRWHYAFDVLHWLSRRVALQLGIIRATCSHCVQHVCGMLQWPC